MPPGVERQGTLETMAAGGKTLISVDLKGWVDVLARTSSVGPAVLLAVVAFVQAPGRVTFDTDLDLALNPWHLMGRAVHLWSARSGFGGVGDQTYGFLFPMGPFFAVGHLLDLPDWVVQRLWCALLLVLAYAGMRRLAGRLLGIAPGLAVLAGLAWALSPRLLTVVGPFSAEALPVALLPWLVLPLMTHLPHDPRRAAWLSGLGVLCLGAVNATATLAVRRRRPRRGPSARSQCCGERPTGWDTCPRGRGASGPPPGTSRPATGWCSPPRCWPPSA